MPKVASILLLSLSAVCAVAASGLGSQVRAQHVLDAAMAAMGGEAALLNLRSIRREFVEDWVDVGQGRRPCTCTPAVDHLPPHAGLTIEHLRRGLAIRRKYQESTR